MIKLHITQDDHGLWMVSVENEDGLLNLVAYEFATSAKAVEHANDWMKERNAQAMILIDPPRPLRSTHAALAVPDDYPKPRPRRAGA
jgi:hypothetical protein